MTHRDVIERTYRNVVLMRPSYINIDAHVDEGTMVDPHALVGSCAQIGKRVHLSAAAAGPRNLADTQKIKRNTQGSLIQLGGIL